VEAQVETIRAWLGTIRNENRQAQGRKRRETGNETGTSKQNRKHSKSQHMLFHSRKGKRISTRAKENTTMPCG